MLGCYWQRWFRIYFAMGKLSIDVFYVFLINPRSSGDTYPRTPSHTTETSPELKSVSHGCWNVQLICQCESCNHWCKKIWNDQCFIANVIYKSFVTQKLVQWNVVLIESRSVPIWKNLLCLFFTIIAQDPSIGVEWSDFWLRQSDDLFTSLHVTLRHEPWQGQLRVGFDWI